MCLNIRNKNTRKLMFSLQWHLTAECDQRCKHCYMFDSPTYASEALNQLSFKDCKTILDDYAETLEKWGTDGGLFFTGGDPLLRKDFMDILSYAKSKGNFMTGIMGNPFHLDKPTANALKERGVQYYQISLDGMKGTHDYLRKSGSFDDSLRAFEVLKEAGIVPLCMFTISKLNMHELIDVIRLVSEHQVGGFGFDRLVPVGRGKALKDELISAEEYKELLLKVKEEFERQKKLGSKTAYSYKDTLWGLLINQEEEREIQKILPDGYETSRGCSIGEAGLCVLADGNVMACRRLPIIVGKLPEQQIIDIFENSKILNELRCAKGICNCGTCDKCENCRGCRAVAYGSSDGDYYAKDPQCWYK